MFIALFVSFETVHGHVIQEGSSDSFIALLHIAHNSHGLKTIHGHSSCAYACSDMKSYTNVTSEYGDKSGLGLLVMLSSSDLQ